MKRDDRPCGHFGYYAKCAQCREQDVLDRMQTCRHFTGIQHDECEANVNIRALVGGAEFGWALRIPCLGNLYPDEGPKVTCERYSTPSRADAEQEQKEQGDDIADVVRRLEAGEQVPGVIVCRKEDMERW